MGREIRRVPLGFDWPLDRVWCGFVNPHPRAKKCADCDGTAWNRKTRQIAEDFYDFARTGRRWCDNITQDEADALVAADRLWDFWRRIGPNGWEDIVPRPRVTAEQVNAANRRPGLGSHDGINRMILIRTRAKRLGVYGWCRRCNGQGEIWRRQGQRRRYERWKPSNPPRGPGYQMWETVSEGSPVTPVFASAEGLVRWLMDHEGYSETAARRFLQDEWCPSAIMVNGNLYSNVESCAVPR
jgi:hypothetical protein